MKQTGLVHKGTYKQQQHETLDFIIWFVLTMVLVRNCLHPSLIPIFPKVKVMVERFYVYIGNIPLRFPGSTFYSLDIIVVHDLPTWNHVMYRKELNKISGLRCSHSSCRSNQLLAKGSPFWKLEVSKMGSASEGVILEGTPWAETGKL